MFSRFAEKTYLRLRESAKTHRDIDFIAVSHSDQASTDKWVKSIPQYGSEPDNLRLVVDDKKEAYAAYGLGISSWMHVLSPASMMNVFSLARTEGISNRPTESGTRWQTSGTYAIGEDGNVKWGGRSTDPYLYCHTTNADHFSQALPVEQTTSQTSRRSSNRWTQHPRASFEETIRQ